MSPWDWLLWAYVALVIVLLLSSGLVATLVSDKDRRETAYKLFKIVWVSATGAGGVLAVLLVLYEKGVLK